VRTACSLFFCVFHLQEGATGNKWAAFPAVITTPGKIASTPFVGAQKVSRGVFVRVVFAAHKSNQNKESEK